MSRRQNLAKKLIQLRSLDETGTELAQTLLEKQRQGKPERFQKYSLSELLEKIRVDVDDRNLWLSDEEFSIISNLIDKEGVKLWEGLDDKEKANLNGFLKNRILCQMWNVFSSTTSLEMFDQLDQCDKEEIMRKRVDSRTAGKLRTYPLITQTIEQSNNEEFMFNMMIRIWCSKDSPSSILPTEKCKSLLSDPTKTPQLIAVAHECFKRERRLKDSQYSRSIFEYLWELWIKISLDVAKQLDSQSLRFWETEKTRLACILKEIVEDVDIVFSEALEKADEDTLRLLYRLFLPIQLLEMVDEKYKKPEFLNPLLEKHLIRLDNKSISYLLDNYQKTSQTGKFNANIFCAWRNKEDLHRDTYSTDGIHAVPKHIMRQFIDIIDIDTIYAIPFRVYEILEEKWVDIAPYLDRFSFSYGEKDILPSLPSNLLQKALEKWDQKFFSVEKQEYQFRKIIQHISYEESHLLLHKIIENISSEEEFDTFMKKIVREEIPERYRCRGINSPIKEELEYIVYLVTGKIALKDPHGSSPDRDIPKYLFKLCAKERPSFIENFNRAIKPDPTVDMDDVKKLTQFYMAKKEKDDITTE